MVKTAGLIVALVVGLLVAPLAAEAQPPVKVPKIGWLSIRGQSPLLEAFAQGLRALGYVEGQNILIERRSASGKLEQLSALAAELVRLNVSVIVALDPPSTRAAKDATKTIPIVMRSGDDPTATGLVASFARPGGNITGVSSLYAELSPKRLELLKETLPGIVRVGVLWDPAFWGSARPWRETEAAARALGLEIQSLEARRAEDFEGAFRTATRARSGALITLRNPLIVSHQQQIVKLAAKSELPAMYDDREFVDAGGLMSYGANLTDLYRRAATYVDKILKGVKPAELPVEQPTRFELVINGKTAKALGLTIPQSVLIRADHVIR